MTINLYLALSLTIVLMAVLPTILFITLKNKPKTLKICASVLFFIYLIFLFIGTTGSISLSGSKLSISLNFNKEWFSLDFAWFEISKTNTLINLFLLFPIGFVVYTFTDKKQFLKTILFSFLLSIIIELYQWVLPIHRNTEVSDVIFNTISGVISAVYLEILTKLTDKKDKL